jgi:hypothetical protein
MTARGLFLALGNAPDAIHVLEDVERLTQDRDAQGVLRSALWAPDDHAGRLSTWTTAKGGEEKVHFNGGIIMAANRPLANLPELQAMEDRIAVYRLQVSDAEMAAQMRHLARAWFTRGVGGKSLTLEPDTCPEIVAFLLAECQSASSPLTVRLYENSCLDYLQWEGHHSGAHWHDLIRSRVREYADHFSHDVRLTQTRDERLAADRQTVRDICRGTEDPEERLQFWRDKTGRGRSSFYQRKGEINRGEFET